MSTFSVYEDLCKICDKDWLTNIFIASGMFDEDKFSIYDKRGSYEDAEEIKHLQIKNGLFKNPTFVLICNKVCQLVCIGEPSTRGKRNICLFYGENAQFLSLTCAGIQNIILKKIKESEYLQSNGNNIYYFPYAGMKTNTFFSFVQLGKNEYMVENLDGNILDSKNIREISDRQLLKTIFDDCYST